MIRREFLQGCCAGTAAVTMSRFGLPASTLHVPGEETVDERAEWDMSWLDLIKAPHRSAFDVTEPSEVALFQAANVLNGYTQAHGLSDNDVNIVLVLRHQSVQMALNDDMWRMLGLGSSRSADDSTAVRNIYLGDMSALRRGEAVPSTGRESLARLMSRKVIVLACNMALMGLVSRLQERASIDAEEAQRRIRSSVADGIRVMPSGVFALSRAQSAGCGYHRPG